MIANAPGIFRPVVYRPSQALRMTRAGAFETLKLNSGRVYCRQCLRTTGGVTDSPGFWENGIYVWCEHCKGWVLALPVWPHFELDLCGERRRYPLVAEHPENFPTRRIP